MFDWAALMFLILSAYSNFTSTNFVLIFKNARVKTKTVCSTLKAPRGLLVLACSAPVRVA